MAKSGNARVALQVERGSQQGHTLGQKWSVEIRNVKSLSEAERRAKSLYQSRSGGSGSSRVLYAEWVDS